MINDYRWGVTGKEQSFFIDSNSLNKENDDGVLLHCLQQSNDGTEIKTIFRSKRDDARPEKAIVFRVPYASLLESLDTDSLQMLVNSENINNGTAGLIALDKQGGIVSEQSFPKPESHWWTLLGNKEQTKFALYGFLTPIHHRTSLAIKDGFFECSCLIQKPINKGAEFVSDTLLIIEGDNPHCLLRQFGDICAAATPGRVTERKQVDWNSWDYYFSGFENKDLHETLDALSKTQEQIAFEKGAVVLDDGWFTDFGEWEFNSRFPSGKKVTESIKENGFTPGIWLAPFIVHFKTNAFLRTPEICATDNNGDVIIENWGVAPNGFLDPTHPAGKEFLIKTFKKLYDDGFRYFKLDFLHYLITFGFDKKFYDNTLGRMEILRTGLQIIRDTVGEDSFIVACGCPSEAGIGIVDACRIGGDISTYHSTTETQAPFLASRYWMNGRFFQSDPDFLMVRGDATAEDINHNPYHAPNMVDTFGSRSGLPWNSINEPRIWATLVAMSGGVITLADHVGKLNQAGIDMTKMAIKHSDKQTAYPLDLMKNQRPELWLREGKKPALAVINWDKEKKTISIPINLIPKQLKNYKMINIWENSSVSVDNDSYNIELQAHDVCWIEFGK